MSVEVTSKAILEVTSPVAPELPVDPNSREAIEARVSMRAREIRERIEREERSQRCTNETMNLQFDAPGGRLWRLNHPNN